MSVVVAYDSLDTLRALIDLADDPKDVRTTTDFAYPAVVVPDEVYQRYERYQSLLSSPPKVPKKKES